MLQYIWSALQPGSSMFANCTKKKKHLKKNPTTTELHFVRQMPGCLQLLPSCHLLGHMVCIIQIGSVGSIIAMPIFPKQMAPEDSDWSVNLYEPYSNLTSRYFVRYCCFLSHLLQLKYMDLSSVSATMSPSDSVRKYKKKELKEKIYI